MPGDRPHDPPLRSDERRLIEAARGDAEAAAAGGDSAVMLPAGGIAGYEILHEIHRGGQGVVYRAHQKSAGRTVAIKVMREGPFAGPLDRARFDREVRILGALRHPNIVAIHDSGQSSGHFYYVMDYIAGQSLDAHVAERKPDLAATLRLFLKICDAVNAAHLRGIVHRDLKPGNVRVDASGEPFILDFGLARGAGAWCQSVPQPVTVTGQFIGSLQWASPEQTEGIPDRVDMRTDVYSLGVILYHMLTGKFPYDVASEMWVVVDQIRRADPVRPRTLRREIDDDLETILLKCLQKDRERRYQTSGELAKDLRHYLAGEAIEAKRDSSWYVLRKTLQRHRAAVTGAALGAVGLVVFSIVTFAMYRTAETERTRAEREASRARQTAQLLRSSFETITPEKAKGMDTQLIRYALEQARYRVDADLANEPDLAATLLTSSGYILSQLGVYDQAELDLRKALRFREAPTAVRDEAGLAQTRRELAICLTRRGKGGDEAEILLRGAIEEERRRKLDAPGELAESLMAMGQLYYDRNNLDLAEEAFSEAMGLLDIEGEQTARVVEALLDFWRLAIVRSNTERADKLFERIQRRVSQLDVQSGLIAGEVLYLSALSDWHRSRMEGVRERLESALQLQERGLANARHPALIKTLDSLGLWLAQYSTTQTEKERGENLLKLAVEISRSQLDAHSAVRAECLYHYGVVLVDAKKLDEARAALSESRAIYETQQDAYPEEYAQTLGMLGRAFDGTGDSAGSDVVFNEAFTVLQQHGKVESAASGFLFEWRGELMMERREFDLAAVCHESALRIRLSISKGTPTEEIGRSHTRLGLCLSRLQRSGEAAVHQILATECYELAYGLEAPSVATVAARASLAFSEAGAVPGARIYAACAARASLAQAEEGNELTSWDEFLQYVDTLARLRPLLLAPLPTRLAVARCLTDVKRFEEAEVLLLSLESPTHPGSYLSSFDLDSRADEDAVRLAVASGFMRDSPTDVVWTAIARLYGMWGRPNRERQYLRQIECMRPAN